VRFPSEAGVDPLQVRHRARGFAGHYKKDVGQDGVKKIIKDSSSASLPGEADPYIPIYDLQMFEGP